MFLVVHGMFDTYLDMYSIYFLFTTIFYFIRISSKKF